MLILAVDNDRDHLDLLNYFITRQGATVRTAESAREALELLQGWTPDVIVLDIWMPDMDGFDLLRTIRGFDRFRDVPAVAVTALAYESDRQRCLGAGFQGHIMKPYDLRDLLALLVRLTA